MERRGLVLRERAHPRVAAGESAREAGIEAIGEAPREDGDHEIEGVALVRRALKVEEPADRAALPEDVVAEEIAVRDTGSLAAGRPPREAVEPARELLDGRGEVARELHAAEPGD